MALELIGTASAARVSQREGARVQTDSPEVPTELAKRSDGRTDHREPAPRVGGRRQRGNYPCKYCVGIAPP
jgi:hypothetical protein